ncbi:MAG: glycine cleavage system protein H [Limisphaerales bacterium]
MAGPPTIFYKRATFVTHLPVAHLYSPSHAWLARSDDGHWRVGYTKFALRMLGELVDLQFDRPSGAPILPGEILGSIEGFKAVSDVYSVGDGTFLGGNPALKDDIEGLARDPYVGGWLYAFEGRPDSRCLDVEAYQNLLNATIDRILAQQKSEPESESEESA